MAAASLLYELLPPSLPARSPCRPPLSPVAYALLPRAAARRDWAVKVSSPVRVAVPAEDAGARTASAADAAGARTAAAAEAGGGEFDPAAPPPFVLADIRAAIPKHCWVKDPWRSVGYVARDMAAVLGLAAAAAAANNWVVWPLYWVAQGTMFWALFVLGHDW